MNNLEKPKFAIYPKKDRSNPLRATLYFRAIFQFVTYDKSLSIKIELNDWDAKKRALISNGALNKQLHESYSECKEKIMAGLLIFSSFSIALAIYYYNRNKGKSYYLSKQIKLNEALKAENEALKNKAVDPKNVANNLDEEALTIVKDQLV
jgi:cell division protein FtsB